MKNMINSNKRPIKIGKNFYDICTRLKKNPLHALKDLIARTRNYRSPCVESPCTTKEATTMKSTHMAMKSQPRSPQLEKAHTQQEDPVHPIRKNKHYKLKTKQRAQTGDTQRNTLEQGTKEK